MTQKGFTIGTLANNAGVNVETIRFYQRRGLLVQPDKPLKGIRHYTERDVQRVRFIKQSQKIGFSLDEVSALLSLEDAQHCDEAKAIAIRKLALIRERIEALRNMGMVLSTLVDSCANNPDSVLCPMILTLLAASI